MSKDYYKVLGVNKSATKDDVKKAFRKLAGQYHPDRGGDESKFKEINEAYQVLGNEKKRAEYDTYGQTFGGSGSGYSGQGGPTAGWDFSGFSGNAGGIEMDLGDIFSDFFGGRRKSTRRGRDISVDLEIPFRDSIFGITREVVINKNSTCDTCNGTGGDKSAGQEECTTCKGRGMIKESRQSFFGSVIMETACKICAGAGKKYKSNCKACAGHGIINRGSDLKIVIPAGIDNGEMIRMTGLGEGVKNGEPGDLYVKVYIEADKQFTRQGHDLIMDLPVKLTDAILGADYEISTLDGKRTVPIPAGTDDGTILKIKDLGVPIDRSGRRGNILVRVRLKMPTKLGNKAREIVEKLRNEGI